MAEIAPWDINHYTESKALVCHLVDIELRLNRKRQAASTTLKAVSSATKAKRAAVAYSVFQLHHTVLWEGSVHPLDRAPALNVELRGVHRFDVEDDDRGESVKVKPDDQLLGLRFLVWALGI
ncbi:hypothetical protein QVD17_26406 [Tagetes erecta]|uniref:Uncharacterized protein n=1 Tax=Tagetes erecta TaxID=13708 RepID=A0AAD8KCU9_TARER|nr:hypothetical protein QVD17_26406 [Tagetes erecta]